MRTPHRSIRIQRYSLLNSIEAVISSSALPRERETMNWILGLYHRVVVVGIVVCCESETQIARSTERARKTNFSFFMPFWGRAIKEGRKEKLHPRGKREVPDFELNTFHGGQTLEVMATNNRQRFVPTLLLPLFLL